MPVKLQVSSLKNQGEYIFEFHFLGEGTIIQMFTVNKGTNPTLTGHNFG